MLNNRTIFLRTWLIVCSLAAIVAVGFVSPSPAQDSPPAQVPPGGSTATTPGQARPAIGTPSAAAAQPEEPPTEAERTIDAAVKKLVALESVSADLVQDINMLNQKYSIDGHYLKAPNSRIYLRLRVSGLPDSSATILQICDGETLWEYQAILESQNYRKLSIKPILQRLESPELEAGLKDKALTQMGLAGPDVLLVGLRRSIKFDQKEEDVVDGKKVWKLRGTWRTRQGLVGPDGRQVNGVGFLPPYIPMDATLYIGKEDGWPYKMILVGRKPSAVFETRRLGPDGRPIGAKSSIEKINPSEIRLTYTNVKLNPKIKAEEFAFQAPASASVEDSTELIVKGLDQAIQVAAAKKKSEAAKKDGPVLEQPIDIPSPTDTPAPRP
jgi:outer membrane lipoprotein-sorting protein